MAFPTNKKQTPLPPRVHLILFLALFFAGILCANVRFSDEVFWMGFRIENLLRQYTAGEQSAAGLFSWFLHNRFALLMVLYVVGFFHNSRWIYLLSTGWFGCSSGFFSTALIQSLGLKSFLLLPGMLLPQLPFFLVWYLLLIKNTLHRNGGYLIKCLLLSGIYAGGVISEYYCNPWILEKLCRLISLLS